MDSVVQEVNLLCVNSGRFELNQLLFADDTALVADSDEQLCRLVNEFGIVCGRRNLRVNVGKSKVMRCSRYVNACETIWPTIKGSGMFKLIVSQAAADGGCKQDVVSRMNERQKSWPVLKSVLSKRGVGINVNYLYGAVIV